MKILEDKYLRVEPVKIIKIFAFNLVLLCVFALHCIASDQCLECHEEIKADHEISIHRDVQCIDCHAQAVQEDHEMLAFDPVDCRQCHSPHDERTLHDAHSRVACIACHIKNGIPALDSDSGRVIFSGKLQYGTGHPHQAILAKTDEQCIKCHFQGNTMGASSMVLPAKSILCMPCHVATFSVEGKTTIGSLVVLMAGMIGLAILWFSGSSAGTGHKFDNKNQGKTTFASGLFFLEKVFQALKIFLMEALLLKRLFLQSKARWTIHSLIFFPILLRFIFGLTALLFSIFLPETTVSCAMLDKNHVLHGLFFDITGLMILTGTVAALARKKNNLKETIASLPGPGRGMTALIGLIVLLGFILEGMRIAMTGWPQGAGWAFCGYGVSLLLKGISGLTDIYGILWYAHAILTGVFVALIPFTRMTHIIIAPVILIMNALRTNDHS